MVELHGDTITDASGDSLFIEQTISSPSQIKLSQADLTGTSVLSIDGVDVSGMTESAAGINKVPKLIPPRLSIDGVDGGDKSEKAEGTCDYFFGEMGVLMQSW